MRVIKIRWYSSKMNRWYTNTFQSEKKADKRIQFLKERNVTFRVDGFCGFCQGECTGNHYISPSTDGY